MLVPFPFTDLSGSKVRPAVIVSRNMLGDDVVVVFVSSRTDKRTNYDVSVDANSKTGLKTPSVIKCSKIATLDKKVVLGELGILPPVVRKKLFVILKKVFF